MWYKSQLSLKGDEEGNRIKSSDPLIGDNAKAFLGHSKVTIRQGGRGGGGGGRLGGAEGGGGGGGGGRGKQVNF